MVDDVIVRSFVIYGLVVVAYLSWLGMVALFVVGLRRLGSGWSREERLWAQLKASGYAWLLLLLSVSLAGVLDWVWLSMVIVWVALLVMTRMIGRRLPPEPFQDA
jgi:hypothetical protein